MNGKLKSRLFTLETGTRKDRKPKTRRASCCRANRNPESHRGPVLLIRAIPLFLLLVTGSILRSEEPGDAEQPTVSAAPEATVRSDGFPEITIQLPLGAIPPDVKGDQIRFAVREGESPGYAARIRTVQLPEAHAPRTGTGPLYAIVVDATKSVPTADFRRSIASASSLVEDLPPGARLAVFRINGKPTMVHDFDADPDSAPAALRHIRRDGKVTRIYDSLFYALRETASEAKKTRRPVGGLILFTDGRDEGSYLTEEDCLEIAAKGQDLQIPIFVVLNGAARNERLFKRMALRSGGELFRSKVQFSQLVRSSGRESDSRPKPAERENAPSGLQIVYSSTMPFWKGWPGTTIRVEVSYDQKLIGTGTYTVPGLSAFISAHPLLFGILFLLLIALAGLFVWLLLRSARRRASIREAPAESPTNKLNIPEAYSDIFLDLRDPKNNPPPEPGRRVESEVEPQPSDEISDPKRRKQFETDAITLNLKEKAYVVLQMALKEAPPYTQALLVKKERDMNRLDQRYDLFLDETYIGNSSGATLALKDIALAGIHAKVKRIDKKYILFDLGAATGTFLNGKKVLRPMPLRSGDEIRMGHSMFIFRGEK